MKSIRIVSVVAVLTALISVGCSSDKNKSGNEFILDNPTSSPITVAVDGDSYDIPAFEYVTMTLQPGRHSMTTAYGEKVDFIVTIENNGGVLNPTRSTYYKFNMKYIREDYDSAHQFNSTVLIDSIEYEIPASEVTGVIIDEKIVDWQFPIHTPFDEVTYVNNDKVVTAILYKLFTKKEFIGFLEEGTEYEGYHEANKVELPHQPVCEETIANPYFVPDFRNEELKKLAGEMMELDKEYGKTESAGRQRELMKEYMSRWKTFVEASLEDSDHEETTKIAELKFQNFAKGVIVL